MNLGHELAGMKVAQKLRVVRLYLVDITDGIVQELQHLQNFRHWQM